MMETKSPVLTEVDYALVNKGRHLSANTEFALEAVSDFVEMGVNAAEVSGWPDRKDYGSLSGSLYTAIRKLGVKGTVGVSVRTIGGELHIYLKKVSR